MSFPLSIKAFRLRFPEFAELEDEFIQAKLDEAELEIDLKVWGDKASAGHGWLTADRISLSAYGREVVGGGEFATTTYGIPYENLRRLVGRSYRLILD